MKDWKEDSASLSKTFLDRFDIHWYERHDKNLVSIVIATQNRQNYLEEALNSLSEQSYCPIEVIVINDGSTDDTETTLQNWKSKYRKKWDLKSTNLEKSQGPSFARNTGIYLSRGEYISFLDDDDLYHRDKISEQVKTIRSLGADIVFGSYGCFSDAKSDVLDQVQLILKDEVLPGLDGAIFWILNSEAFCSLPTALIKRHLFSHVGGFDATRRYLEDYELILRMILGGAVIERCPSSVYYRRIHQDCLSRSSTNPHKVLSESWSEMLFYFEDIIKEKNLLEKYRLPLAQRWGVVVLFWLLAGNGVEAQNCMNRVLQLDPHYSPDFPPYYSGWLMKLLFAVGGISWCAEYKKLRSTIRKLLKIQIKN